MTDTVLEDLTGVGPATADQLEDDGYTVKAVADADEEELEEYLTAATDPSDTIADARDAVSDEDVNDGVDEAEAEVAESEGTTEDDLVRPDIEIDEDLLFATLRALTREELEARRTNNTDRHETAISMIESVSDMVGEDDPDYAFSADELNVLYTALNKEYREIQQLSGFRRFPGRVKKLTNAVQEARRANWPNE